MLKIWEVLIGKYTISFWKVKYINLKKRKTYTYLRIEGVFGARKYIQLIVRNNFRKQIKPILFTMISLYIAQEPVTSVTPNQLKGLILKAKTQNSSYTLDLDHSSQSTKKIGEKRIYVSPEQSRPARIRTSLLCFAAGHRELDRRRRGVYCIWLPC
jgi:hypothetical protein